MMSNAREAHTRQAGVGAMLSQPDEVALLLASLTACNNGYLFAPRANELRIARANALYFAIDGGLICSRGFNLPRYARARQPAKAVRVLVMDGQTLRV